MVQVSFVLFGLIPWQITSAIQLRETISNIFSSLFGSDGGT